MNTILGMVPVSFGFLRAPSARTRFNTSLHTVAWIVGVVCGCGAKAEPPSNMSSGGGLAVPGMGGASSTDSGTSSGGRVIAQTGKPPSVCAPNNLSDLPQGEGGAHLTALCACNECGWPAKGSMCQSLMNVLPLISDPKYQACWGGQLPDCIRSHEDSCSSGLPQACADIWTAQAACMTGV